MMPTNCTDSAQRAEVRNQRDSCTRAAVKDALISSSYQEKISIDNGAE